MAVHATRSARYCGTTGPSISVAAGSPAGEILGLARARGADLIVLGASGTGALERMLFGSTVLAVVRAAACPVMVVRPPAPAG